MANVDDASFATYLATFHSTYSDTVEAYVPAGMRGFLDRFSRLSCEVVGYVSTSFGVAFEYVPGSEGIRVGHSSARVEDFFCHAPARVRKLPAMFIIEGGNSGLEGLTLEGAFPFRFGKEANGPVTLADVRFKALGWTRDVYYAEVFPVRVQEEWTRTKAVERAKDEVLRALADIQAMDTENVSLAQFLAGQKQTSVLVAGDFSPAGRKRLDAIRRALRDIGYLPRLLADVPEVFEYDLPEKFAAVATMARFVVIDDSSAAGHIRELADAAERGLLTIVLRQEGSTPSFMTRADALKSTVLREFTYSGEAVRGPLYEATQWAEEQLATLSEQRKEAQLSSPQPAAAMASAPATASAPARRTLRERCLRAPSPRRPARAPRGGAPGAPRVLGVAPRPPAGSEDRPALACRGGQSNGSSEERDYPAAPTGGYERKEALLVGGGVGDPPHGYQLVEMPPSRSLPLSAATAIVLLAAAGCGGPPGEKADARSAVETLLLACAEGEPSVALELLTEPARAAFARGGGTAESCAEALGLELGSLSPEEAALAFEEAAIPEVETEGGFASAIVEVAGQRREVEVELVGGRWLVNNPTVPAG